MARGRLARFSSAAIVLGHLWAGTELPCAAPVVDCPEPERTTYLARSFGARHGWKTNGDRVEERDSFGSAATRRGRRNPVGLQQPANKSPANHRRAEEHLYGIRIGAGVSLAGARRPGAGASKRVR